jgi:hypothetical protein
MESRLTSGERSPLLMQMGMFITYKLLKRSSFRQPPKRHKNVTQRQSAEAINNRLGHPRKCAWTHLVSWPRDQCQAEIKSS